MLRDAPTSILMVIGEHDRNVQWDLTRAWSSELPHVSHAELPDSGYLVHHQHFTQLLRSLRTMIDQDAE